MKETQQSVQTALNYSKKQNINRQLQISPKLNYTIIRIRNKPNKTLSENKPEGECV